jgi:hypothetical protein
MPNLVWSGRLRNALLGLGFKNRDAGCDVARPSLRSRNHRRRRRRRLRCRHRRRRAAAVAVATDISITMTGDDITPAQPATAAQGRRPPSGEGGVRRGVSWSNEELIVLIVQGYSISSDSAVGAGQTVAKNAGRMRAPFIEKVQRTRAPLTLIKFSVAVRCYSKASDAPRRRVGRCTRLC